MGVDDKEKGKMAANIVERKRLIKENALKLVREHKENCHGPDCGISVSLVGELLLLAGIRLTSDDWADLV